MTSRLATSAMRCLSLRRGVRSSIFVSAAEARFVRRNIEEIDPRKLKPWDIERELAKPPAFHWPPDLGLSVYEIKCTSSCLQLSKADIYPKPETVVYYHDRIIDAYSLKEDGTISPNYDICLPSFLKENYTLSGASCNGLLHFHSFKSGHALWNPTTSEYKILPKPLAEPPDLLRWIIMAYGMWSDHKFEDVKVMHLKQFWLEDNAGELYYFDLYSLKTNSWRRINCTEFDFFPLIDCACLDGVFYCKAFKNGVCGPVFCSFDLSTEIMSTLPFPELSESEFKIIKYKGLLSVVEWLDDKDDVPWKFQLWSLRDGTWTRESAFHTRGIRQMLWFSPDGKLLYFASLNDELVVFDRSIGMLKHLGVKWFSSEPKIIPFVESFGQLNGISHVEETHEPKKEEKDEAAYDVSLN